MRVLSPLRVNGFRRLAASYTINELGDSVGIVALAILVYDGTGDALSTTALFIAAKFLPALLSPALTARFDRVGVRRVLPSLYAAEALTFVALALVADGFWLPLILLLALIDGTLALTARGLTRGAVAALLSPRDQLRDGNALLNVCFAVGVVGGSALGGALVSIWTVQAALLFDAASFAAAGLLIATATGLVSEPGETVPLWTRLKEGLSYARSNSVVRRLLVWQAAALVFFTLVVPIEVIYVKETLHSGDAGFGLLLSSWGLGIVLGSLAFIALRRRSLAVLVFGSTAMLGSAYLGMAAVEDLWAACLLSVVGGFGNGIQWVSAMTLLQEATPMDLQARMVGFLESLAAAMPGVGFIAGGVLVSVASPPVAFATAGGCILGLVGIGGLTLMFGRDRLGGRGAVEARPYESLPLEDPTNPRAESTAQAEP